MSMPIPPEPHHHDTAEDCPDCGHRVFYCEYYQDYFHSDNATCFLHQWTHTDRVKAHRDDLLREGPPARPDTMDWEVFETKFDTPQLLIVWEDDGETWRPPIGYDVGGMVHYNRYDSAVMKAFGTVASEVGGQFLNWEDFPFVELEPRGGSYVL